MPKRAEEKRRSSVRDDDEYVKSAAWAWYQHGGGAPSKHLRESDVQNMQNSASAATRPSRFKLEADRLANLSTTPPSLHTVIPKPKSLDGLYRTVAGGYLMFESHEGVGESSLLDHYEIVELSRHLERSLSISVKKSAVHSEKSWIERGLSTDLVNAPTVEGGGKKKVCKAPKTAVVKRWWVPALCSVTDVVIPQMAEIGSPSRQQRRSSSMNGDLDVKEGFHGVRQRLQRALVVSPANSPPHGKKLGNSSSARRNALESSHKR